MSATLTKNDIYEVVFTTISNSKEWGTDCESKEYGNYICGICDFAQNLLEEIENKNIASVNQNTFSM